MIWRDILAVFPRRIHRFNVSRRCLFRGVNKKGKPVIRRTHLLKLFHRKKVIANMLKDFDFIEHGIVCLYVWRHNTETNLQPISDAIRCHLLLSSSDVTTYVISLRYVSLQLKRFVIRRLDSENRTVLTSRRHGSEFLHVGAASSVNYRKMSSLTIR